MHDRVVLTIPRDAELLGLARLVVGGLAARLDFPFEGVDDLQLAVEAVLTEIGEGAGDIELQVDVHDERVVARIGPFESALVDVLEREAVASDAPLGLGRVLSRLVDSVEPVRADGVGWLSLAKCRPAAAASP
jgi:hypothetical protein